MFTFQDSPATSTMDHASTNQDEDFLPSSFSNVKNTYNFHVVLRSYFILDSYSIYFVYGLIFWSMVATCGNDINLDCITNRTITSPDYPSRYPNDASEKWYITAPSHRRILVTFNDFSLEDQFDALYVIDMVNSLNVKRYTGDDMRFPPFLAQGHSVEVKFTSSKTGRREGFSISVSCNEISSAISVRLAEGTLPSEGFIELSRVGEWKRVCEDNLPDQVPKVICGELGYPGVKEISYKNSTCISADLGGVCTRAPNCPEKTYRLEDCTPNKQFQCSSDMFVKLKCYEPGFKGCYNFNTLHLQNGFTFTSTARCITTCKTNKNQAIAVMNNVECFCTTIAEAQLMDRKICSDETELTAKMLVYNVSESFCDELNDTVGGSWDSNITWFGSIVHLTCMDGYTLNGNGTLQCVPGLTPYYPVWNDSIPFCILDVSPTGILMDLIIAVSAFSLPVMVILIAVIMFIKFYHEREESRQSWKRPGQAEETRSSHHTYSGGRTAATNSRRHPNSPSTRITNDSTSTATLLIPFALSDNLYQDSQPSEALPPPPPLHPSNASNRPFGFLYQNNPPSENHYASSNSDANPYYYASSFENQRADRTRVDGAHDEEQYAMGNVNHAYEETDDQGQSNATLQNINPYHYASSFDTAKVPYTFVTDHEEGYKKPSIMDIVNRPYEGTIEQGQSNTTHGNRLGVKLTMISRPLPHRPSSSNCIEGPTPPPRKTPRASRNEPPASTTLGQKKSENVSENNNFLIGECSSDLSGK